MLTSGLWTPVNISRTWFSSSSIVRKPGSWKKLGPRVKTRLSPVPVTAAILLRAMIRNCRIGKEMKREEVDVNWIKLRTRLPPNEKLLSQLSIQWSRFFEAACWQRQITSQISNATKAHLQSSKKTGR